MERRAHLSNITPLPSSITRHVALAFLHDHIGMIELNPLVIRHQPTTAPEDASQEEREHCSWYEITDIIHYLPGGWAKGEVSYKGGFYDMPNGLQTHVLAPAGVDLRGKWTVGGNMPGEPREPAELGVDKPKEGLYLREETQLRCNIFLINFVKRNLRKSHDVLVQDLIRKANDGQYQPRIGMNTSLATNARAGSTDIEPQASSPMPSTSQQTQNAMPELIPASHEEIQCSCPNAMALLGQATDFPMHLKNKGPEWEGICNNVLDQYLQDDDLFGLDIGGRERSSSDDSGNLFDFSTGSEQSHRTDATSPIPSWDSAVIQSIEGATEAKQPVAKEPVDFWTKTLRALEQNAAESERKAHTLRTAKSHPDFLSLGGCPSPPAIPSSPTDQSFSVQRCRVRSRGNAANGRKASQARSVSRGRPTGVTKYAAAGTSFAGATNPYATVRKSSASPAKMMTPSRYRAGFRDVWAERMERSPKKYELRVPPEMPASPLLPARFSQEDEASAAFGGHQPNGFVPLPSAAYDEQLSPLTKTFQRAHLRTPITSPGLPASRHNSGYFEDVPPVPSNPYLTKTVPLNDTAPLFPDRTTSVGGDTIQAFDFASPPHQMTLVSIPSAQHHSTRPPRPRHITPPTPSLSGLGISCDPSVITNNHNLTATLNNSHVPATIYQPILHQPNPAPTPYLPPPPFPARHAATQPNTPHRKSRSPTRRRSDSPSPSPPRPGSRTIRASSSHRRTSKHHRRVKSTSCTPRAANAEKGGGFVNFTPSDHTKILSGVAPSGSSKTKARREKEAADKSRRLSQAARRAVVEAGGDVEALTRAGLLG
ncbi:regulatory protein [Teratosphaeria destructans]|uniref:Regulatory protein n=1 Tax=Teratosphaeria destructans TaxID=418781 RepID=A0A9W7W0W3_9PEZI|nr:regulatory protein [Teratosphaeria destructans]